jgi:hypothetical protein
LLLVYRVLVRLYPAAYRGEYSEEILAVLRDVLTENRDKSPLARIVSASGEIAGLLSGAFCEHVHRVTDSTRGRKFLPGRLTMRSDFRFPKATVSLMALVLLAVFLAIEKGKDIQASIAFGNPQMGPIHVTQPPALLRTLLFVLGAACVTGAIGWAILFAFGRSGSHRLSDADTSHTSRLI